MGLLYFFDRFVKPKMLKGTQDLNPAPTGVCGYGVRTIRQGDVNLWLYTKGNTTIAIDTGHLNEAHTGRDFASIGVDPRSIHHVLLTHADVDHAGGIDAKAKNYLYPEAQVYLGKGEEAYLKRESHRMIKLGLKIYNCVALRPGYRLLEDEEVLDLDGIRVRCISVPGHTLGHMCYLVEDRILFSGDCLSVNEEGGYAFWDFFCQDGEKNKESLQHLKELLADYPLDAVCTGHSGFVTDTGNLFKYIRVSASFKGAEPFDPRAPKDVCKRD